MKRGGGFPKIFFKQSFKQLIKEKFKELYEKEEQEQNQTKRNNNSDQNQLLKTNLALKCITDFFSTIQDIQDIPYLVNYINTHLPNFLKIKDIIEYQRISIQNIMKIAIKEVENEEQNK